jgi:hypothetical protein
MSHAGLAVRAAVPVRAKRELPVSFEEAIRAGWMIVHENTGLSASGKKRSGKVVLGIEGRSERLSVPYTATPRGYSFGSPELIQ